MTALDIGPINPAIAHSQLRIAVTVSGAFTLWGKVSRPSTDGVAVLLGDTAGSGSWVYVSSSNLGIAGSGAMGSRGSIDDGIPPASCVFRIRRDVDGEVYFAWTGKAEFVPTGSAPNTLPYTFDVIGAARTEDSPGGLDVVTDAGCTIDAVRIEAGELTPAEREAIEIDLFGFTL